MKKEKLTKIEKSLEKEQKGARARTWSIEEVEEEVKRAEEAAQRHPAWTFKHLTYVTYEAVSNSYKNAGQATYLRMSFTQKGKVKDVSVVRRTAKSRPFGGLVAELHLTAEAFREHFEQEEIGSKLKNYLFKSLGFGPSGKQEQ